MDVPLKEYLETVIELKFAALKVELECTAAALHLKQDQTVKWPIVVGLLLLVVQIVVAIATIFVTKN